MAEEGNWCLIESDPGIFESHLHIRAKLNF